LAGVLLLDPTPALNEFRQADGAQEIMYLAAERVPQPLWERLSAVHRIQRSLTLDG
jgi:hypothetical protein